MDGLLGRQSGFVTDAATGQETYTVTVRARDQFTVVTDWLINSSGPPCCLPVGLDNPKILASKLHPVSVSREYTHKEGVYAWQGVMQSAYSTIEVYAPGRNYGYKLGFHLRIQSYLVSDL